MKSYKEQSLQWLHQLELRHMEEGYPGDKGYKQRELHRLLDEWQWQIPKLSALNMLRLEQLLTNIHEHQALESTTLNFSIEKQSLLNTLDRILKSEATHNAAKTYKH